MYQRTIRSLVAIIVIFGHVVILCVGIFLGISQSLVATDAMQVFLTSSPILAITAVSALFYIMNNETVGRRGKKISTTFAFVVVVLPIVLISLILVLLYLSYIQIDGFGPDALKITLGAVETVFGLFLGGISKTLFENNL